MDHAELIRQRGGIRPLARKLGHTNHTTVQGWLERGNIPADHIGMVLALSPEPTPATSARRDRGDGR